MLIPALRLGGSAAALLIALPVLLPAFASAASKGADLRVVNRPAGRWPSSASTPTPCRSGPIRARIASVPRAEAAIASGSGRNRARHRPRRARDRRDLRPLSITDQFSFGLAVCGIGGFEAGGSSFWYLKRNHVGAQVGGDQLSSGTAIRSCGIWRPAFPPVELVLRAPARARPGVPFEVSVLQFDESGARRPAAGATVSGARRRRDRPQGTGEGHGVDAGHELAAGDPLEQRQHPLEPGRPCASTRTSPSVRALTGS